MAVVKTERVSEEEYKARLEEMSKLKARHAVKVDLQLLKELQATAMPGVGREAMQARIDYYDKWLLENKEAETFDPEELEAIQKAELRKVLAKEPVGEGVNKRQYQEWLSVWKKVASAQQNDQVAYHDEYMKAMDKPTRFDELLEAMRVLHARKEKDYGAIDDPKCNIRASEEIGIPAWKACWMRARDKVRRIDKFCRDGVLENEGVKDSLLDLANYCLLVQILLEEVSGVLPRTPDGNEVGK